MAFDRKPSRHRDETNGTLPGRLVLAVLTLLLCPAYLGAQQLDEVDYLIHVFHQLQQPAGQRREIAMKQIERHGSEYEAVLVDALEKAEDPKEILRIIPALSARFSARRQPFDMQFYWHPVPYWESVMANGSRNFIRPIKTDYSEKLRAVLFKNLAIEIRKYQASLQPGPAETYEQLNRRYARLDLAYRAISSYLEFLQDWGDYSDIDQLRDMLMDANAQAIVRQITYCIQRMCGDCGDVAPGWGWEHITTKQEEERYAKEAKAWADKTKKKVLDFLKGKELTRDAMMHHFAQAHLDAFKLERERWRVYPNDAALQHATHFPDNLTRFGPPVVEYLQQNFDLQDESWAQTNFESFRATITGKCDEAFVAKLFDGKVKIASPELAAVEIVRRAGSKEFKNELLELTRYLPTKEKEGFGPETEAGVKQEILETWYRLALRSEAAKALAYCHRKEALDDLRSIPLLPVELGYTDPGYYDPVPDLVKELEAYYVGSGENDPNGEAKPPEISRDDPISEDVIRVGDEYIIGLVGQEYFERTFRFERSHSSFQGSRGADFQTALWQRRVDGTAGGIYLRYSWTPLTKIAPPASTRSAYPLRWQGPFEPPILVTVTLGKSGARLKPRGFVASLKDGQPLEPVIGKQAALEIVSREFAVPLTSLDASLCPWSKDIFNENWTWQVHDRSGQSVLLDGQEAYWVDAVTGQFR